MRNTSRNISEVRNLLRDASRPHETARLASFTTGHKALDAHLGGGFRGEAIHEVFAANTAQSPAADAFALGLALRVKPRSLIWIVQTHAFPETGLPYGPGVEDWGLDTQSLVLVRVKDAPALLSASEEALASGAADAVLISAWGEAPAFTLTASRRLGLAAAKGRSTGFFLRAAARPAPSAAETRWRVSAAPSTPLAAQAPGRPALAVELLRSRSGAPPAEWIVEWDREERIFSAPSTPVGLVSLPADRATGTAGRKRKAA